MNTNPEAGRGYFLCRLSFLMMLFPALLSGCATTATIRHATRGDPVYEQSTPVQRAYRTPAGDLLLCTNGKLAQTCTEQPYYLHVTARQLQGPATDCGYRGELIEVPRSGIRHGWPDDAAISRDQLTVVPVSTAERGMEVGTRADAFRNQLQVVEGAHDTLYNITGYGSGSGFELVYVRRDDKKHIALTLQPVMIRPHLPSLCFLPVGILIDGILAAGVTCGILLYPFSSPPVIERMPNPQEIEEYIFNKIFSRSGSR